MGKGTHPSKTSWHSCSQFPGSFETGILMLGCWAIRWAMLVGSRSVGQQCRLVCNFPTSHSCPLAPRISHIESERRTNVCCDRVFDNVFCVWCTFVVVAWKKLSAWNLSFSLCRRHPPAAHQSPSMDLACKRANCQGSAKMVCGDFNYRHESSHDHLLSSDFVQDKRRGDNKTDPKEWTFKRRLLCDVRADFLYWMVLYEPVPA